MNDLQKKQIIEAQAGLTALAEILTALYVGHEAESSDVAECIDPADIAREFDVSDIAECLDASDIADQVAERVASNIDCSTVAYHLDTSDIAAEIQPSDVADYVSAYDIACNIDASEIATEIDTQTMSGSVADMMMSDGAFVEQLTMKMLKTIGWQSQSDREAHYNHQLSQEKQIAELKAVNAELRDHLRAAGPSSPRI